MAAHSSPPPSCAEAWAGGLAALIATNTNNVIILRSLSAPEQSKHLRPNVFIRHEGQQGRKGREAKRGEGGRQGQRQRQRQRALLVSAAIAAHKSQATAASPPPSSSSFSLGIVTSLAVAAFSCSISPSGVATNTTKEAAAIFGLAAGT